jgi:ABC-type nitrate/sulfonate/bicarbonate transport system ATPase subunit
VAGILAPTSGSVSRPRRIGFVFQDDRLLPWQTALKNTALPLRHGDGGSELRKMADSLAAALLEEFGLGDEWDKYPEELSGGMRKRAAFARCFARDPGLILLDEPFSGLHREARGQLWARFLRILERRRLPVVVVTHYPEELEGDGKLTRYTLAGNPARIAYLGGRRQAGSGRRGGGREGDSRR